MMMHYRFLTLSEWLVVTPILAVLVRADYIMDDSNSTIHYVGDWSRSVSGITIDSSKLYDGTV